MSITRPRSVCTPRLRVVVRRPIAAHPRQIVYLAVRNSAHRDVLHGQPELVAPIQKVAYPTALSTLRDIQCPPSLSSLWAIVAAERAAPAHNSVAERAEKARQAAKSTQRTRRADARVILPDGIGLHGLFLASSAGSTIWLETQNCRRWRNTQAARTRAFDKT